MVTKKKDKKIIILIITTILLAITIIAGIIILAIKNNGDVNIDDVKVTVIEPPKMMVGGITEYETTGSSSPVAINAAIIYDYYSKVSQYTKEYAMPKSEAIELAREIARCGNYIINRSYETGPPNNEARFWKTFAGEQGPISTYIVTYKMDDNKFHVDVDKCKN